MQFIKSHFMICINFNRYYILYFPIFRDLILRFGIFCTFAKQKQIIMSKDEINKYRLTDMEEPSDEMLEYIMHEVAEEAKDQYNIAIEKYFSEMTEMYRKQYGNGSELQQ